MSSDLPHVLLVDDEPDMLDFLARALRQHYRVWRCKNAAEAASALKERNYALLITDQTMPGRTGLELLESASGEHPDLVRVLLSGFTELPQVEEALSRGCIDAYALKPIDAAALLRTVAEAASRRAGRRAATR